MRRGNTVVTLITPTRNRQFLFELTERWMKPNLESYKGDIQWIVADDSIEPTKCTLGQELVRPDKVEFAITGVHSFLGNMRRALERVTGDIVCLIEDDDWVAPDKLAGTLALFTSPDIHIVGEACAKYYHVPSLSYHIHTNHKYSSWTQTAFRAEHISIVIDCINHCNDYLLDMKVWRKFEALGLKSNVKPDTTWTIGMKGLTQRNALGAGHNNRLCRLRDPQGAILRKWIGDEATEVYFDLIRHPRGIAVAPTATVKQPRWG